MGKYLQSEEKVLRVFKQMRDSLVKDFLNASYPDILRKACRCAWKDKIKDWSARNHPELTLRWNMETEYAVKVTDGVVT